MGIIASSAEENVDYRLNDDVKPIEYTIHIRPYFEHDDYSKVYTFDGYVIIRIKVLNDNVKSITLHKKELNIHRSRIAADFDETDETTIVTTGEDAQTDKYTIALNRALVKDESYTLILDFIGMVREQSHGLYRSSYFENNATQ